MGSELIFAFDVGKASLGSCARFGDDILDLDVLLTPAEFASTQDLRTRRRAWRTRLSHKKREQWLINTWQKAGLDPIDTHSDPRMKREFPQKGDDTLFNSALLRIALLQNLSLEEWQIFKALWAAIQHRGYDAENDWSRHDDDEEAGLDADTQENRESATKY